MSTVDKRMWHLLRFMGTCWKLNLAGAMEFRLSFLLTAGMMLVNNAVWIFFWGIYFSRFPVVKGWELTDVMMMWSISAGGFGLMAVLFGNANRLAGIISTGQLDTYLAQPKPVLLHVLISRMSVAAMGDIIFSLLLFGLFGNLSLTGILKFALALLLSMLIFIFFNVVLHSLAFFIGNAEGLSTQFANSFLAFTTYPTGIFQGWGRLVLFTVMPAGFISYLPIGLLRGIELPFLLGAIGVALGLCAGGVWFFYCGLRRYSSGNMMAMKS